MSATPERKPRVVQARENTIKWGQTPNFADAVFQAKEGVDTFPASNYVVSGLRAAHAALCGTRYFASLKSQSARPRCESKMTIIDEEGGFFFFLRVPLFLDCFCWLIPFISAI